MMNSEFDARPNERSQLLSESVSDSKAASSLRSLFERPASTSQLRPYESFTTRASNSTSSETASLWFKLRRVITIRSVATTVVGSCTFLLYQVVFCLAQAATITPARNRHPDDGSASSGSRTGSLAQMAALGALTAGPHMIFSMNLPALYPATDLFIAPFLARIADKIDSIILHDLQGGASDGTGSSGDVDSDQIFLATLGVVVAMSMTASGILCVLAGRYKVANLGAFLPYSVLCGFFATIGILMWSLGFHVDTGVKVTDVIHSITTAPDVEGNGNGNGQPLWKFAAIHHAPSFAIGVLMHLLGPAHPLFVIGLVVMTVAGSYGVLWLTGTSLAVASKAGWFYSGSDLGPGSGGGGNGAATMTVTAFWQSYGPPYPFGVLKRLVPMNDAGSIVHWGAVHACLPTAAALSFLYLIRCSLHSAAVRKNISNVTRASGPSNHDDSEVDENADASDAILLPASPTSSVSKPGGAVPTLGQILERGYGYSQFVAALVGGFPVAPSVAASVTMFKLGAEGLAPQYGSCFLVLAFYVSNFEFVQYIPKPAFSCLMVLAGLDMCKTWLIGSWFKTQSKVEWIVTPVLIVAAFTVGLLSAIVLGVALSTFLFAAHFYHSGIVRFVGNGVTLRSTVERGVVEQSWLDRNASYIQILVLQHYLFFGNAQSVLNYVSTMFEEVDDPNQPPVPLYLIIDFCMVSGMDTSAMDLFKDILALCKDHRCSLLLSGLRSDLKAALIFAGIKPMPGSKRFLFAADLEAALAQAEDGLLLNRFRWEEKDMQESERRRRERSESTVEDGFLYALKKIDEQHGLNTLFVLREFRDDTIPVELEANDVLERADDQGLYFVETGTLCIQPASNLSTRNASTTISMDAPSFDPGMSLGAMNARALSSPTSRQGPFLFDPRYRNGEQSFRLARVGQGTILGTIEAASGLRRPCSYVAASSSCRLHHLPPEAIRKAERDNPMLAMNLYKTLAHVALRREELTIQQLGQLNRILRSPTPRLRGGKQDLGRIQNAM